MHCGISAAMRGRLRRQVNYVVHCAASIIFNEHVHTLLANNYEVKISDSFSVASTSPVRVAAASFHDGGHFLDSSLRSLCDRMLERTAPATA